MLTVFIIRAGDKADLENNDRDGHISLGDTLSVSFEPENPNTDPRVTV